MNIIKTYFKQIDIIFFYLSVFTLTQSIKLSSKFLFLSFILGLIKSIYTKNFKWFSKQKSILFIYSIFLIYIFTQGILVDGFAIFFQTFEKYYAPYLIFLLIPIFYQDSEKVKLLPKILITGILFTFLLILFKSALQLELYNREQVLATFKLHHLYISLYILFAINYLLASLSIKSVKTFNKPSILKLFLVVIFSLSLVFFKSKAAIVIAVLLFGYYMLSLVRWNKLRALIFTGVLAGIIYTFNSLFLNLYLKAIDFRGRVWSVALELFQNHPLFGYGGSKEHAVLNRGHFINGNYDFLDSHLNSHNQYLSFLLKFGLIGLFLILSAYAAPLFKMKQQLKKEYIGFLILVGLMAFIESIYNRHHGIVFCTIFIFYYNTKLQSIKNDI